MIDELSGELSSPDLLIFLEGPLDLSSSGGVHSNVHIVNALSVKVSVGVSTEKTAAVAILLKENLRHESLSKLYGACIKIRAVAQILGDYHHVTYMLIPAPDYVSAYFELLSISDLPSMFCNYFLDRSPRQSCPVTSYVVCRALCLW